MKRLILTAHEFDQEPSVDDHFFLGLWCLKNTDIEEVQSILASNVVEYPWDNRDQYLRDYTHAIGIFEETLNALTVSLNLIHSRNYSAKFWRIVVGPWLGLFLFVLLDRWRTLESAADTGEKLEVLLREPTFQCTRASSTADFSRLCISDAWNEAIYLRLISEFFPYEFIAKCDEQKPQQKSRVPSINKTDSVRSKINQAVKALLNLLQCALGNNGRVAFVGSAISFLDYIRVAIRLKKIPKVIMFNDVAAKVTPSVRKIEILRHNGDTETASGGSADFIEALRVFINSDLPEVFVENFAELEKRANFFGATSPVAAVTAFGFWYGEVTKTWMALNSEKGVPLIGLQHGGSYGMANNYFNEYFEVSTADHWGSWGWTDNYRKNLLALGAPRVKRSYLSQDNRHERVHIILNDFPVYFYRAIPMPLAGQAIKYFEFVVDLIHSIRSLGKITPLIRPYPINFGWDINYKIQQKHPDLEFSDAKADLQKELVKYRLNIVTYNATATLESLACNVPTVLCWDDAYWDLHHEGKIRIERLTEVGIFQSNPSSAANHINKIWENVDEWWYSSEVQTARTEFCKYFHNSKRDPIEGLCEFLGGVHK